MSAQRARFDEGLRRMVGEIYRARGDLFEDRRAVHGWVTGYLGDPFAPVWFVAENPSLRAVTTIEARHANPTPDCQWTITPGDLLFRKMLAKHGFKRNGALAPGGWACYITDVIKAPDVVKEHNLKSTAAFLEAAKAWAPALSWELQNGCPRVVVSVGDKARRALNHLVATGCIPEIPHRCHVLHYQYVASRWEVTRGLPGGHEIRKAEYDKAFGDIAAHSALKSPAGNFALRTSDGRELDLGPREQFVRTMQGIRDATRGSSGQGRWSYLFGYVDSGEVLDPATADRVAEEARDFRMVFDGHLPPEVEQLLERLGSLTH